MEKMHSLYNTQDVSSRATSDSMPDSMPGQPSAAHVAPADTRFRASPATELQDLDIWRIVACLPGYTFDEIKKQILSLCRDRTFALNYWVKVCKLRATRGLPMPWDLIH